MEPGSSLPHLQVAAACPYSEPHQYRLCPPSHFLKIHLNIIPSTRGSSKWYFSFNYHHQILYTPLHSPINSTCLIHLMHGSFTRTVLGRSTDNLGFSLCSFFRSPVTSFLVDPNILRSTVFSNKLSLRSSLSVSNQVKWVSIRFMYSYLKLYHNGTNTGTPTHVSKQDQEGWCM